jgi:hypothetical protein
MLAAAVWRDSAAAILLESDAWPEFARMIAHDPALIGYFE